MNRAQNRVILAAVKEYSLDPSTRQLTKKAFCGKETSLVTAALSTTSAVSPARVSIYTNKRAALASPAKFGTKWQKDEDDHPFASKISPSAVRKQEFDYGGNGTLEGGR